MALAPLTQSELDALYGQMSVYGDTYQRGKNLYTTPTTSDKTGIAPILLPPITGDGGSGGNEQNINKNINYDNLIVRNQSAGTGIDSDLAAKFDQYKNYKYTDQDYIDGINQMRRANPNFHSRTDEELKQMIDMGAFSKRSNFAVPQKTGILETLKTKGSDLLSRLPSIRALTAVLPKQDPRGTALRGFYGDNFGLTSSGSVASGIMQGYNPVSGGFLNLVTGGKYGDETQYGLTPAIDKRMDNIKNMLDKKHSDYLKETGIKNFSSMDDEEFEKFMKSIEGRKLFRYGIKGHTSAAENYFKLKSIKQKEAEAIKAAAAAAEIERRRKIATTPGRKTEGGGREVATDAGSVAGAQQDISNYESFGEIPFAKGGRVRKNYFDGGIVTL